MAVKLIALDMDGTLLNPEGKVSPIDREAVKKATQAGIEVVISSGRPYVGLSEEMMQDLGIRYALTTNGAAIYEVPKRRIYEESMSAEQAADLIRRLAHLDIYMDFFVDGNGYGMENLYNRISDLALTESLKAYIKKTRTFVPDLAAFVENSGENVQKITLDFFECGEVDGCVGRDEGGELYVRKAARKILAQDPAITVVSGGFDNLEITRRGVDKGSGLAALAAKLGIELSETMAMGDSENDSAILKAAGIGVAMANSEAGILKLADYVTDSNGEGGVAKAIARFTGIQ